MAKKDNDWKDRLKIIYTKNPDYNYQIKDNEQEDELIPANMQKLRTRIEKKGRGGKTATVISGFIGPEKDLEDLARTLKTHCGTGGSVKDGEIIIQGELKDKVITKLKALGYTQSK
mgnify:CR=1 FL=1